MMKVKMQSGAHFHGSRFSPILHVLRRRKYVALLIASGFGYAIAHMFIVGIISFVPEVHSATGTYPVIRPSSIGFTVIPIEGVFLFIFYGALAFLAISAFLVGLNISLMFYSRRITKACGIRKRTESKGLLALLPTFFTSFSCCGGGLLALAIGPTAFSLSLYSQYIAPLSVAVLAAATYLMSSKISRMGRC